MNPNLDPLLSLAFAVHSNPPGVYAVLLGSGISRAASIPTGWEVVLDLVRKVAALKQADCGSEPAAWYAATFGEAPDHGKLLQQLAKLPAERQSLLRAYFEANEEERSAGLKQPTKAHRAIASLVQSGHVRVIVTTNFDRLLEQSLETVGIAPTVISTGDAAEGAMPLTHARCTIVKLHGDYLDARIKNTPEELADYDSRMNALLDRVFDEFGLIVSGWSADWDEALRAAMQRCKSRRFTTFWSAFGESSQAAKDLAQLRGAELIGGMDADSFFVSLLHKVEALTAFDRPHPLSAATAIATTKRFLSDSRYRIELYDLVHAEVEKVVEATCDARMPCSGTVPFTDEEVRKRVQQYEASVEVLVSIMATGAFWGDGSHRSLWVHALERIGSRESIGGLTRYLELRLYPAIHLFYAAGIAAVAGGNYGTLKSLFFDASIRGRDNQSVPADVLHPMYSVGDEFWRAVFRKPQQRLAMNEHLFEILREPLRSYLADDRKYEEAFERFEYLLALACVDRQLVGGGSADFLMIPFGRFVWRRRWYENGAAYIAEALRAERAAQDDGWPPIQAEIIGSRERFDAADQAISKRLAQIHRWQ